MYRIQHYVYEVYREKSFSRAAQNLFIAQSSLSTMVKKHEQELGIQIFDRSTSPISLTDAGEVYIQSVRKILTIESELDAYLKDYNDLKTGILTLGAPHFFSSFLLPSLIAQFHQQYPGIQIKLIEADYLRLFQMLMDGELELLLESAEFDESLFTSYSLFQEQILLAVPHSDPINKELSDYSLTAGEVRSNRHLNAEVPCAPLERFQHHKFLLLEKGHDLYARTVELCAKSGFQPKEFMRLNQLMTSYNLTNQQLAASFVSDSIVKLATSGERTCFYKLEGASSLRQVYLAHKRNRYKSLPMRKFIELTEYSCREGLFEIPSF